MALLQFPGFLLYVDIRTRFGYIGEKYKVKGLCLRLLRQNLMGTYEPLKSISVDELNSPKNSFWQILNAVFITFLGETSVHIESWLLDSST